jgi:acetyl-CoA acetyltransferase
VQTAAASIIAGMDRVVVAGGVQSSSTMPKTSRRVPGTDTWEEDWLAPSHRETPDAPIRDMTITVGWNAAVKAGISREDMDAWAYRSHMRAVAGIDGFSITAGNAAGVNDGAAAVIVTSSSFAEGRGLEPLAIVRAWASAGVLPAETGLAPSIAIPKALDRAGLKINDIDLWEINEAFASVPVAVTRELGIDDTIVNVLGSGCSLGHPVAMTGTRMVLTLVHELRRRGGGTAVAAMCAGGGMASALILEVPAPA